MTNATTLVQQAEAQNARFPQYAGHWNGWEARRVVRYIRTKAGEAFLNGDVVLVDPTSRHEGHLRRGGAKKTFVTAYSFRTQCDTSIPADWLEA